MKRLLAAAGQTKGNTSIVTIKTRIVSGYRFKDYVKAGAPLKLAFWALSALMIPLLWPMR